MGRWFYYIRVSSKQQNLARQEGNLELLEFCKRMNIEEKEIVILSDKLTGKTFERPNYQLLKKVVAPGDNIVVSSIDRFGRNYLEGRKEFTELISKGVKVYVLNRPMLEDLYKLNDNMSKFMINFLVDWELISAEEELKRIKERQRQGIEVAKSQGKHMGRPRIKMPENFGEIYSSWKAGKKTAKESMELLGLKRNVFYKMAKEYEKSYIVNDK
ncbi:recombinase family protein [Clostridium perfringens]|uniref:recombinase family protein n=1 Tax=Clostridium perfringens TaxID=1502 RepID=UPI002247D35F|nr:recombinase family protein [Clostridium perfringens]MCX0367954.1 recombinase family protein [Clostridium perfringens]MCX0405041.1 recombinase family protein [Clostridium perfringens]